MKILIINGPNLNLLGKREPETYGSVSFDDFLEELKNLYKSITLSYFQSNNEGVIVDKLQSSDNQVDGILLNAAAYTHTSIAIADAISAIKTPVVEIHISNVFAREAFRHHSYISPYCKGVIAGFGLKSYVLGLEFFLNENHQKADLHSN